jgi:hypothetical protein
MLRSAVQQRHVEGHSAAHTAQLIHALESAPITEIQHPVNE